MKMRNGKSKPKGVEWIFCLLLIPVGLFFSDTRHYVGILSCVGLGGGIGGLIGLTWRLHAYNKLSPQQKREVDREERDERNAAIREKAGNLTWNFMTIGLFAAAVISSEINFTVCMVFYGLLLMGVVINLAAHTWYRKKM